MAPVQLAALFVLIPCAIGWHIHIAPLAVLLWQYGLAMIGWVLLGAAIPHRAARNLTAAAMATSFGLEAFLGHFELLVGNAPSMHFLLDSPSNAVSTAIAIVGTARFILYLATVSAIVAWAFIIFRTVIENVATMNASRGNMRVLTAGACIFVGLCLIFHFCRVQKNLVNDLRFNYVRREIPMIFPDNSNFSSNGDENIIIVQLESTNALAAAGTFDVGAPNETFRRKILPTMTLLGARGVFFPLFWGNSMMTNRAQENILCRVAMNLQPALSFNLQGITGACLPTLLRNAGYATYAYRSDDLEYSNEGKFLSATGFEEVHNDDIMHPEDEKHGWGYDDCVFYRRSFEHLRSASPDRRKVFAYIEVSTNHLPFDGASDELGRPFQHPKNFREQYLNSVWKQDSCLRALIEEYDDFAPERTHLFILPDHSWPANSDKPTVNSRGAWPENFLVNLLYIPPTGDENYERGVTVDARYSETDIMGTVFDLLNDTLSNQSFAWRLKKGAEKPEGEEDCHVLTQPYDNGNVVIVRGDRYVLYKLLDRTITFVDLKHDLKAESPSILQKDVDFKTFWKEYGCAKYGADGQR